MPRRRKTPAAGYEHPGLPLEPIAPAQPPAPDPIVGPGEFTDVCYRCRRAVRRSLTRQVKTPTGRTVRECVRAMAASCSKISRQPRTLTDVTGS